MPTDPIPPPPPLPVPVRRPLSPRRKAPSLKSPFVQLMIVLGGALGILMGFAYIRAIGLDPFAAPRVAMAPTPKAEVPKADPIRPVPGPNRVQPKQLPAPKLETPLPNTPIPELDLTPQTDPAMPPPPPTDQPPAPDEKPKPSYYNASGNRFPASSKTDDRRTVAEWLDSAQNDRSAQNRQRASNALLEIVKRHSAKARPQPLTSEEQEMIRVEAKRRVKIPKNADMLRVVEILGPVADDSCRSTLLPIATRDLSDKSKSKLRQVALGGLASIADDSCVRGLEDVAENDVRTNQLAAVKILGTIGSKSAKAALVRLSKSKLESAVIEQVNQELDRIEREKKAESTI